jgi:phospholipid/cholesterol/gamma-HCH transport system substrate-binding protein
VLGDPFLEVDPGIAKKAINSKGPLFGTDPPRLDLFLADAAELVKALNRLLVTNAGNIDRLIKGSAHLVSAADDFISDTDSGGENSARFSRIMENVEQLTVDARVLLTNVNDKYVDNPKVEKTISHMSSISAKLDRDLDPLIKDIRSTIDMLNRVGSTIGPQEQQAIRSSLARLDKIARRTDDAVGKVQKMVDKVARGEGTAGAILADEEIYDDLKQLIRDIKQHPWKLIWED